MTANYMVITVAACEAGYVQEALGNVSAFVGELMADAGCFGARYRVVGTGADAGSLILFQRCSSMADIEKMFAVYAASAAYQATIKSGKLSVAFRNILKLDDVPLPTPSSETPGYGVVTMVDAPGLTGERMQDFVPIFEANGTMLMRYGTLLTGPNAGKKVLGVTYPSMDAIEKTYDALRASAEYQALLDEITLIRREIVRFAG